MSGNEAIAQGAIDAGCRFYAGYPITPQNELPAYMAAHMPEAGGVFIQSESEISAINMVFGGSAAGVRAMTSSSSPGISLKQEGISYIAGAQLPAVIVNIMRGGPGLGNILPSQSDYFQATRGGGHGDYRSIVLAPSSVQEAYDLMSPSFEMADKYRMPVIILGDGMLGQMMEPVSIHRKKQVRVPKEWELSGCKGRRPRIAKSFYLKDGDLEKANIALQKKYRLIEHKEQRYEGLFLEGAKIIVVAYGTMARIARSAVRRLRAEGKKAGLLRPITLWPFPKDIIQRLTDQNKQPVILVVEMSCGQMAEDVCLAAGGRTKVDFLGRSGGGIPTEEDIIKRVSRLCR